MSGPLLRLFRFPEWAWLSIEQAQGEQNEGELGECGWRDGGEGFFSFPVA
jgi:hypothetical protein